MAKGVNKVIIIGNVGQDPESRVMGSSQVVNIRVATSENWKDKNGMRQERTEWHKVALFNKLGDIAMNYVKKGSKVFIEGSLRTNKWQDKNGVERYTTEIIASNLQLLDSRNQGDNQGILPSDSAPSAQTSVDSSEDELDEVPF